MEKRGNTTRETNKSGCLRPEEFVYYHPDKCCMDSLDVTAIAIGDAVGRIVLRELAKRNGEVSASYMFCAIFGVVINTNLPRRISGGHE